MRNGSAVFYRDLNTTPPVIVRGQGCYLEDSTGRRYLDGSASAGVVAIGHGRSEIFEALAREGDKVSFVYNATFTHPWQEELARPHPRHGAGRHGGRLFRLGRLGGERVRAGSSRGSTSSRRGKPQKYKAIARWQSYHGVTLATLSLSGRTSWRQIYSPLLLPVPHIAPPYRYRCAFCAGQGGCTLACADDLERAILLEGPDTVAAFFAEPIVGTTAAGIVPHAGLLPARARDLRPLRRAVRRRRSAVRLWPRRRAVCDHGLERERRISSRSARASAAATRRSARW